MCEYCEGKYGSDLLIKGNESVFIDVAKGRLELVKVTRDGYGLVTFDSQKINYCPVCGRKLRRSKMARAVFRKNKDGKVTYVGHVPPEYKLKDNEFFQKLPNERHD